MGVCRNGIQIFGIPRTNDYIILSDELPSTTICRKDFCEKNPYLHSVEIDDMNEKLHLISESYDSAEIKKLSDEDNPLNRVNEVHARMKNFLHAHTSFDRDSLQGYLNLFSFTMNPPTEHLEKVETLLNLAINTRKSLRYRSFYRMK